MDIHQTAIVHPQAKVAAGVKIGAYSLIGENVCIGNDTVIESHVVVEGWTEIGERCHIFPFVSIGAAPQAVRYRGEPTRLIIGNENVFREFVTVKRGTVAGGGETVLLLEIGPAVDHPKSVRPYGFMGCIDHCLCRASQRLERRQRQPSVACWITVEIGTICFGYGSSNLIDHTGSGNGLPSHLRLRPPGLLRLRLDGGF